MEHNTKDIRYTSAVAIKGKDAINDQDHSINFVVSSDIVDRDNEMVMADAVYEAIHRKDEFHANPICLPCHKHRLDSGMPPCVGHWDVDSAKKLKHRVEMRLRFAVGTDLGDTYWFCYSNRHMSAVSIGFRILEGHEETKDGKRIYIITKIELYEISCVGVPSNTQAQAKLKAVGEWREDAIDQKAIVKAVTDSMAKHFDDLRADFTAQIEELKDLLITDPDELAEKLMLGEQSEPSARGDDNKAEQLVNVLKDVADNLDERSPRGRR